MFRFGARVSRAFRLATAPEPLKADKEVVLAAVRQNGDALQFAAPELRDDIDVVTVAVRGGGGPERMHSVGKLCRPAPQGPKRS